MFIEKNFLTDLISSKSGKNALISADFQPNRRLMQTFTDNCAEKEDAILADNNKSRRPLMLYIEE
ncbi:hypothetical protein [Winslowiella iniecta]|uniref:Uncharacterized protein n=1 Tax=Winslowiella iniecta TaxID=1560201 RepID=A0A0L7TD04_9GAMM|nr:hypothetical protein [Winslowiella iniecta]KOC88405.1 hypothetical protein NG42_16920 [Winslowiella iniecta]KOC93254.1 hypothetical protein NG43_11720 [Winslowiella iniecta]